MRIIDRALGPFRWPLRAPGRSVAILWCLLALWQPTLVAIWHLESTATDRAHADCDAWRSALAHHGVHENRQFEPATPASHQHHAFLVGSAGPSLWLDDTTRLLVTLPAAPLGDDGSPRLARTLAAASASRGPPPLG